MSLGLGSLGNNCRYVCVRYLELVWKLVCFSQLEMSRGLSVKYTRYILLYIEITYHNPADAFVPGYTLQTMLAASLEIQAKKGSRSF